MKTTMAASALLTLLLAAQVASAQTGELPASISPGVFSRIVKTILRDEFKPAQRAKTIYISDQLIDASWLPKINNIEFIILNEKEFEKHGKAYIFNQVKFEGRMLRVDFGYGDLHCSATGESFFFRIKGDTFKRVRDNGGWGRGCATGNAGGRAD
jgi:hypothetical protein